MIYWFIFCVLDGINDGYFYHYKNVNIKGEINEHAFKLITRLVVGLLCCNNYYDLVSFALVQSFIYNNAYYNFRHFLNENVYYYGFNNMSRTSTAKMTKYLNPINRFILFVFGLIIFVYLCRYTE